LISWKVDGGDEGDSVDKVNELISWKVDGGDRVDSVDKVKSLF
jgi:hypothetical protein